MSQVSQSEDTADPGSMDRHFETSHLEANLGSRSVRGGVVAIGNHAFRFVIQTGGTMLLARILAPEEFGLVAMVSSITGLVALLGNLGLSAATYQRSLITHREVTALFWINVSLSVALSLIIAILAPAIAWFYGEPRLINITLILASSFIFSGLSAQHYAILTRQMRFVEMAATQTIPLVISITLGVGLAWAGWGYWALVSITVCQSATTAIATWVLSSWRPGWPTLQCNVSELVRFGSQLTGYDLLVYLMRNVDNLLIGRFLGAETLGIYSKAYGLLMLPVQQINPPLNGVILPALSRLSNQPDRFRNYYLKAVAGLATISMPVIVFAFVDADLLVSAMLGPQWDGAGWIFRLLTPAALTGTINLAPSWLFTSLGNTGRQLRWAYLSAPVIIGGFIIGLIWGAPGVAASFSISFGICFTLFAADACRQSPVKFADFLGAILPPFGASVIAASAVFIYQRFAGSNDFPGFITDIVIFSAVYLALCGSTTSGRTFMRSFFASISRKPKQLRDA